MNLTLLSNTFRIVAEQSGLNRYHFGYPTQFATTIGGDLGGSNMAAQGQQYPALMFIPPDFNTVRVPSRTTFRCELVFGQLMDYDYNSSTHLEQFQTLIDIVRQFIANFDEYTRARQSGEVSFGRDGLAEYELNQGVFLDRLITVTVRFSVSGASQCFVPNFDPSLVVLPYTYPASSVKDEENV